MNEPEKSQTKCYMDWLELRAEFMRRIDVIDHSTPAEPTTEPAWWVEMMEVRRTLQKQQSDHEEFKRNLNRFCV